MKVEISAEKSFQSQPLHRSAPPRSLSGCMGSNAMVTEVRKRETIMLCYGKEGMRNRECLEQNNEGVLKDSNRPALNCLLV